MTTPAEERDILSYYESYDEEGRLARGSGALEFARMQELIGRFLAPPPQVVLDGGGGPGRYACWLAADGYEVHLVDPVPRVVEQARAASAAQPDYLLASAIAGDARSLPHVAGSADAVLLMGPLYHLPEREQRLAALREAHRVLKPGGAYVGPRPPRPAPRPDPYRGAARDAARYRLARRRRRRPRPLTNRARRLSLETWW